MKNNTMFKKLTAAIGAVALSLTMLLPAVGVSAAPTIDVNAKGSINVTKYEGDSVGTSSALTGTTADDPGAADNKALSDVEFTYVKVADIVQPDSETTTLKYTLTSVGFAKAVGLTNGESYTSTELQGKIKDKKAFEFDFSDLSDWPDCPVMPVTDSDGKTSANNLSVGLYLLVETNSPSTVTKKAAPVLVSIPMTTKDGDDWLYDVHVYPKNSVAETDIDKKIVGGDTDKTISAAIGDVINYEVPLTALVPDEGLSQLHVTDTMDKGLTFNDESVNVYLGESAESGTPLVEGVNYTVTTEKVSIGYTQITIDFEEYLNELTRGETQSFYITYNATLNENAVLGQVGNGNDISFTYQGTYSSVTTVSPSDAKPSEPTTKVFTYGIDLTKLGEGADVKLEEVKFKLTTDSDGNTPLNVQQIEKDDNTYYTPGGGSNVVTTIKDGKIAIRGLKPGTYYLTETKTNEGYQLLKDPIEIVITQTDKEAGVASATVGGVDVTMTADDLNEGSSTARVPLSVQNNKGFNLPQTGAAGTAIFAIAGIVLVMVAGALLVMRKKAQNN